MHKNHVIYCGNVRVAGRYIDHHCKAADISAWYVENVIKDNFLKIAYIESID